VKSELRLRTPEGIVFSYQLAGPIARCVALAIDTLIIMAILIGSGQVGRVIGLLSPDLASGLMVLAAFVVVIGYGVVTEWALRGQTIGKRYMRLRVMDAQGLRLQFHQILMRNLLRPVDLLPAFYVVGGIACLLSKRCQRLGDLAANTVVVHMPKYVEPDLDQLLAGKFNSLRQHPHLEARLRQRASAEEARLALQALVRRDDLDPVARVRLFSELAENFKEIVAFPPEAVEAMPDEQYVHNVADILFRTRSAGVAEKSASLVETR
jgi:uncharacterized RDD family membrane protein YckC